MAEVTKAPIAESIGRLSREINTYEAKYRMSTHDMRDRVRDGRMRETADVCFWLMTAQKLHRMQAHR